MRLKHRVDDLCGVSTQANLKEERTTDEQSPNAFEIELGGEMAVVESVKAASDLYMPVSGEIIEINEEVDAAPELVNQEAFTKGWLLKIRLSDESQVADLMKPDAYSELM